MKIRTGFVSNSSTSSFVVKTKELWNKEKEEDTIATEEDIKKLIGYGFQKADGVGPFNTVTIDENGDIFWYHVVCNQHEPLDFLLKNNIPFKASIHYDQSYMSFRRGADHVFVAHNYGIEADMYGEKELEDSQEWRTSEKPFANIPIKEFMEKML